MAEDEDLYYEDEEESYSVRPYTMTGGRTRTANASEVPLEALVEGLVEAKVTHTPERRRILELTATQYLSVMELSAHIKIPVGVVRILVSDLQESKEVRIHGLTPSMSTPGSSQDNTAATLSVLESVLNGIASL
ncbi:MAG: DUF742 domain-containing protein [Actinomycetales bacterium]